MEGETIDPLDINKHPKIIKDAQTELGKIDILVCGQCHTVFHFVEQFQDHRLLGNCSGVSSIRENNINETKAQVWAFLLWKGSQSLDENENSWVVYQRWCKMEAAIKEAWIVAGRNVQVFTKLSAAKMQEVRAKVQAKPKLIDEDPLEEGEIRRPNIKQYSKFNKSFDDDDLNEDPLADSEEPSDIESELDTEEEAEREEMQRIKNAAKNNNGTIDNDGSDKDDANKGNSLSNSIKKPQAVPTPADKTSRIAKRTDKLNNTENECAVEKILAKRFNPRRKLHEYLIKWEGCPHEQNTWEPPLHLDTCKHLVEAFERNLARQKEAKAQAQAQLNKQQKLVNKQQPGPSGIIPTIGGLRPQRTSKQKALDQVKQWCGNISDRDELGLKRKGLSDSDEDPEEKKIKMEFDSGSEDEWQAEESELDRHTSVGRPKILQKSTSVINGVAKKQMTANEIARSIGLASPDRPTSPPIVLNKNVVKVYKNQMPNLATGVYIMSKKDGIVKLESSPNIVATSNANIVRVQKTTGNNSQSVVRVTPKVGQTQVRLVQKGPVSGASVADSAVRLSPGMSRPGNTGIVPKIKTTIKPALRMTPTGKERLTAQRMQIGTPQLKVLRTVGRPVAKPLPAKETPVVYPEDPDDPVKDTDTSEDDFDPFPKDLPPPEPDSPPREFTLDPLTGLIVGQAEGEPEPQPEPEPEIQPEPQPEPEVNEPQSTKMEIKAEHTESETTTDMPSLINTELDETSTLNVATSLSDTSTTITLPETGEPLMITGEDGVVYQVAGQNAEGQTLLVAAGVDGQQQCMYVTTDGHTHTHTDTAVLTLDAAVADAIAGTHTVSGEEGVNTVEPLTVDTSLENDQSGVDDDSNSQVVAQLVKAELPSPGGTRKVVLLLPDGNLLMTEVDAEQYASLELDK